jgi:PTH1 family peptidyl-tRNA hydrolase
MKLIVGLGNPGLKYVKTKHNMGFNVIDSYAKKNSFKLKNKKFNGLYEIVNINGEKTVFLKPCSFINLSGEVVRKFVDYYKISIDDILIINDDLDLDYLDCKLKAKGSSAGHNGLKDIEKHLGTNEYKRLKIGISKNENMDIVDYVLSKFSKGELKMFDDKKNIFINIIDDFLEFNFNDLMNKYN